MAYSYQQAVSDGRLTSLLVTFDYNDRSEISVLFSGSYDSAWAWSGDTSRLILFPYAIPAGIEVTVLRQTDLDAMRHKFATGAKFSATAVDDNLNQLLSAVQEIKDTNASVGPGGLVPLENVIGCTDFVVSVAEEYNTVAATDAQIKANAAEAAAISAAALDAQARATLATITSKAYADGIVSEEEARAIADATAKAEAARVAAIAAAAADATAKANAAAAAAQVAAAADATAKANLATVTANAYADGVVDAEEARAIADATAKANAARAAAEAAAAADATAKANAAALTAQWSGVSGAGKPQDYATVGAEFGVNISGQINSGNVATYVAPGTMGTSQMVPGAAALVYKHTYGLTPLSVGYGTTTNLILDFVITESTPVEITFSATCGNGDGPADSQLAVQYNRNGTGWVDLVPGLLRPLTYSDGASASRIVNVAFAELYTIPAGTIKIRTNVWTSSPGSWINSSTLRVGVIKR